MLKRPRDLTDREKLLLNGWTANYPLLDEAYRAKEAFYGFYECRTKAEAQRYYHTWEDSLSDRIAPAFKDVTSAFRNWRPLILTYFDHRITNAFSESMINLIRLMNRLGLGYSFEAFRAKVLFTARAQVRRPKFERSVAVEDVYMDRMTSSQSSMPRREFSTGSGEPIVNYGVDMATLTRLLESGEL
jgi:transposase